MSKLIGNRPNNWSGALAARRALLIRAARIANTHQELPEYLRGSIFRLPKDPNAMGLDLPDPISVPAAVEARGQKMEDVQPILTKIVRDSIYQAIRENPQAIGALIIEAMRTDRDPWDDYTS